MVRTIKSYCISLFKLCCTLIKDLKERFIGLLERNDFSCPTYFENIVMCKFLGISSRLIRIPASLLSSPLPSPSRATSTQAGASWFTDYLTGGIYPPFISIYYLFSFFITLNQVVRFVNYLTSFFIPWHLSKLRVTLQNTNRIIVLYINNKLNIYIFLLNINWIYIYIYSIFLLNNAMNTRTQWKFKFLIKMKANRGHR